MFEEEKKSAERKMEGNVEALQKRLRMIRAGAVRPSLLNGVKADYYGSPAPLSNIAHISSPDSRSLLVKPFDIQALKEIERALARANLGAHPQNDGKALRLHFPEMTEDRRKGLVRQARAEAEKCKVDLRLSRRAFNDQVKASVKEKTLSEDEGKRLNEEVQKLTDSYMERADDALQAKEREILEV